MQLNVVLLPVEEVLKIRDESAGQIKLETPINLSGVGPSASTPAPAAPAAPAFAAPIAAPKPQEEKTTMTSSVPAFEIQMTSTVNSAAPIQMPEIISTTPAASAPAGVPAAAAASAPSTSGGGLEINFDVASMQIEMSPSAAASAAAATPAAPATPAAASLFDQPSNSSIEAPSIQFTSVGALPTAEAVVSGGFAIEPPATQEPSKMIASPVVEMPAIAQTAADPFEAISDADAARDLPYLFSDSGKTSVSMLLMRKRVGVVEQAAPTEYAQVTSPDSKPSDVDVLKNYLTMREQDIAVLKVQLQYAKEEIQKSQDHIRQLTTQNEVLLQDADGFKSRVDKLEQERSMATRSLEHEMDQMRFELKSKIDQIRVLDEKLRDSAEQYEKLKERVRMDIRKIRTRERELESKLEILKRDSETLIASRESKILELKRRIDLLEFNFDMLQERKDLETARVQEHKQKEESAVKAMRLAIGIIEGQEQGHGEADQQQDNAQSTSKKAS